MRFLLTVFISILFTFGYKCTSNKDYTIGKIVEYPTHRQIEITWKNDSAILSGTLYLPSKIGYYSLAIWSHGSSANLRLPYKFKGHDLFRHCSALTWVERGYAFFSYDKRGFGRSSGGFVGKGLSHEEIFNILADDAVSAINVCVKVKEINPNFIGLFGGSMAGYTIPKTALQTDRLAFAIIINGPVAPYWIVEYFGELTGNNSTEFYFTNCENPNLDSIYTVLDSVMMEFPQLDTFISPKDDIIDMKIPACFVQGGQDLNQPARISISELRKINNEYTKNMKILVYKDADHALITNGGLCFLKQKKPFDPQKHFSVDWETPVFNWLDSLMSNSISSKGRVQ